ncbi:uncharacterized protein LOC132609186 [Lycium barbarum]|uniref:uncharacterized protein LOC132609186 n=1 Tax=Lycium barbarum TaxID=112863 RepID=UPI00293EE09F|nr:uncharacterized protein LOC132609186 [Lycium barbarum]
MAITPENTSEASTGNETHRIVDQTSPYFLHASDSPGMTLVLTPFDGSGYGAWRRSALIALSSKNKLSYIEASSVTPSSQSAEYKMWSRCNDMVTSWLLNSLSKEIAGNLVQGSLDIAAYYTKMKKIWDDLDTLYTKVTCSYACDCGGKDKMNKSLQDERLVQFLMGLNEVYAPGRSNILMMSPLSSVNLAYSLLMQDEKQSESYMNTNFPGGSSSFLATQHYPVGQRSSSADSKGKKMELVCSNCKKLGHTVDKCFRIIGFPANFKFTKNKSQSVRSNAATSSATTKNRAFTQDQKMQMMQMFQSMQGMTQEVTPSDTHANVVHCASNIFNNPLSYFSFINSSSWIIDSEASEHMSFHPRFFTTLSPLLSRVFINLPNSFRVKVTHARTVTLFPDLIIKNVLLVPSFRINLISVQKFCKQLSCILSFSSSLCFMQDPSVKIPVVLGEA